MNRFASKGDSAEPCGVPIVRLTTVPSGRCSGASSHRLTYSRIHAWRVCLLTARRTRSHGTVSNDTPPYYRLRGPRRRGARVGERLAADRGGRGAADRAPGLAAAGGFPAG